MYAFKCVCESFEKLPPNEVHNKTKLFISILLKLIHKHVLHDVPKLG